MKTAVEWLEEELKANLKKVILEGDSELMESLFKQAKEMEKEQSYSEEEVIAFGEFIFKHSLLTHTRGVKSLFEQFKTNRK